MQIQQHPGRLLRLNEVIARVALAKPTIYRAIKDGKFPPPCKLLGGKSSAWPEADIDDWIAQQIADRPEALEPAVKAKTPASAARRPRREAI